MIYLKTENSELLQAYQNHLDQRNAVYDECCEFAEKIGAKDPLLLGSPRMYYELCGFVFDSPDLTIWNKPSARYGHSTLRRTPPKIKNVRQKWLDIKAGFDGIKNRRYSNEDIFKALGISGYLHCAIHIVSTEDALYLATTSKEITVSGWTEVLASEFMKHKKIEDDENE